MSGNDDPPVKLKHFNAQVAMDVQPSVAMSQGLTLRGQQSDMPSEIDIPIISVDFRDSPAPPALGSSATEKAIITAPMIRPIFMASPYIIEI